MPQAPSDRPATDKQNRRVFVAGATGVIGRPLVRQLVNAGHSVAGLTRSEAGAEQIAAQGATPIVADVFDEPLLVELESFGPEVVMHQLTALPDKLDLRNIEEDLAPTNRLRTEGTDRLIEAAQRVGASRFIAQSIAFAYAPEGPGPRREEDPLMADPPSGFKDALAAIRHLEAATRAAKGLDGTVLRYGQLYGPGTAYASDGAFANDVRNRKMPLVGDGSGRFSFVHVDDAAGACLRAMERRPGVYNIVDDEPVAAREWLPYYAELLGAPDPWRVPTLLARLLAGPYAVYLMTQMPGASNRKARKSLGWSPKYPTWRDGFRLATTSPSGTHLRSSTTPGPGRTH